MSIQPRKALQNIKPYVPPLGGRQDYRGLLLDFNEKIDVPTDLDATYPEYGVLKTTIARYAGVNTNQILISAGSGSAIDTVFRTYCETGGKVVIPQPSFSLLTLAASLAGASIKSPMYDQTTGRYPMSEVMEEATGAKVIVICNPNNPTGTSVEAAEIKKLAATFSDSLILVDEAYFEYSKISAIPLIAKYPNVVVLRTFSKAFGLAALRVGYVVASPKIIADLQIVSNPYDVAMPSAMAVIKALSDTMPMKRYSETIMSTSRQLVEDFLIEYAIPFYPTSANFICFKPLNPEVVYKGLLAQKIMVRKVANDMLRVTLGSPETAQKFIAAYKEILAEKPITQVAILDRDATLIFEPPETEQVDDIKLLKLLPGTVTGLKKIQNAGYDLVMVTNQDGIGTKSYPRKSYVEVQSALISRLAQEGIRFKRVFVCPHMPIENCNCRKPKLGLVSRYLASMNVSVSLFIGDRQSDKLMADRLKIDCQLMSTNSNFLEAVNEILTKKSENQYEGNQ